MAEDFLLKWNDHHSLFFSGAERLLREEEFTDVTLAAESKVFRAHKFVLSICSPYFQVVIISLPSSSYKETSRVSSGDWVPTNTSSSSKTSGQRTWSCCCSTCTRARSRCRRRSW